MTVRRPRILPMDGERIEISDTGSFMCCLKE